MKVLFLVPYPTAGASNRYRVEQYLPYLEQKGIKYAVRPFWIDSAYKILYKKGYFFKKLFAFILGTVYRIFDLMMAIRYDIIFIHRETHPVGGTLFETILLMLRKPIIFDFDDAIFLPTSSRQNNFIERFKKPHKISGIIKRSSYVIAGNRYLSDFALRYNGCVSVIPTSIDTEKYFPEKKHDSNEVVIGWMGSVTTLDFLNNMKDVFVSLSRNFSNVRFKIVGGDFSINGLSVLTGKPWSLEEEAEDLRSFDIGIMPMSDNEWTKGKCGFKAILYMNMGIPCVCSPVGVNTEIITDGVNGFLASSNEEWIEKLSVLIKDPALRKRLGVAGRKTVEERYSLKVNAPKFIEILQKTYDKRDER